MFKLSPTKQRDLTEILREVVNYAELEAIAVITKEGLHLAFFAAGKVDSDLLSAISAAILSTGEMAVDKMGFEKLSEVIVRGRSGYIILTDAGKFVLVGAGREATSLGLSVRVLRAYAKRVTALLSK